MSLKLAQCAEPRPDEKIVPALNTSQSSSQSLENEKDFPVRSLGHLQITNAKGSITVQGWALDKIRIKIKKFILNSSSRNSSHSRGSGAELPSVQKCCRVQDVPEGQANNINDNFLTVNKPPVESGGLFIKNQQMDSKNFFDNIGYRYENIKNNIEISSEYGKNLSIIERLRERDQPNVKMDMVISAPWNLNLGIWSADGKIILKGWKSDVDIRSNSGTIEVEGMKGDHLSAVCASCVAKLRNVKSSLRCMGGEGNLELNNIYGKSIYVETGSGSMKLSEIEGKQLYISKSGAIDGQYLKGRVEFQVEHAEIGLREVSGFLSGSVKDGNIVARIRNWEFQDKAIIESGKGNIQLTLPSTFSGNIDISSLEGQVAVDFPVKSLQDASSSDQDSTHHRVGRINDGGELLKVFAEHGDVHVFKDKF